MNDTISTRQAYLAMYSFLNELYAEYGFDHLGGLLGSMSLLPDGSTADPAIWSDWLQHVENARSGQVDAELRIRSQGDAT